jgi:large subunit ribosomal protein L15
VGRGPGSGTGKQSGRGVKGQKARTGHHGARFGFEGGQMPMQRRLPKFGFKNPFRSAFFPLNVGTINETFDAGTVVTVAAMQEAGLVPRKCSSVKVLGNGDVTKKLTIKASAFSGSAQEKIQKVGGTAEVA